LPNANAYLFVLPVPAYRVGPNQFAVEGAFAAHLKLLREKLGPMGANMVMAAPCLSEQAYQAQKASMAVINEREDGIRFNGVFPLDIGRLAYFKLFPLIVRELKKELQEAAVVHAGNSPLYRPFEFVALWLACRAGKITISVTDIDSRDSARMNYVTGRWSWKEYCVTRFVHDVFGHWLRWYGCRRFSLVMYKGLQLVADYGRGRPNVKYILDSAFGDEQLIPQEALVEKASSVLDPAKPIELT
jgi:hypothetical protein